MLRHSLTKEKFVYFSWDSGGIIVNNHGYALIEIMIALFIFYLCIRLLFHLLELMA